MFEEKINLADEFRKIIAEILLSQPDLAHNKTDDGVTVTIAFPKTIPTGFDITVRVGANFAEIQTDAGWHTYEQDIPLATLQNMIGLVRDMLSPGMRVRELCTGGNPYRWNLEVFDGTKWINEATTSALFWNYFGKRTENIFQNTTLPVRKIDLKSDVHP